MTLTPVWASGVNFIYNDTPAPAPATWFVVEFHYLKAVVAEGWAGGVLAWSYVPFVGSFQAASVLAGNANVSPQDPDNVAFINDVRFGTTRGGSDLFADNFESGDLSAWDFTAGDVTVVADPFGAGKGQVLRAASTGAMSNANITAAITAVDEIFGYAEVAFDAAALALWASAEANEGGEFIGAPHGGGYLESIHIETVDIVGDDFPEPPGISYAFGHGAHESPRDWTRVDDPGQPSESGP